MDSLLEAFRKRQLAELEAAIDVEDRLRRLKATNDTTWWDELAGCRDSLVATAARALAPPLGRGAAADEYAATAGNIVNEVYGLARYNAAELRRLSTDQRRRWLRNAMLERVDQIVRGSRTMPVPAPGLRERH